MAAMRKYLLAEKEISLQMSIQLKCLSQIEEEVVKGENNVWRKFLEENEIKIS